MSSLWPALNQSFRSQTVMNHFRIINLLICKGQNISFKILFIYYYYYFFLASRHIKRIHEKIAPVHECPHCSKSFYEKFDLARHVKTHDASKRCEKCHKLLPSVNTRKHICKTPEAEQDPNLKCTVCGIYLETKVKWGFHMWKHTKDPIYIQTRKPLLASSLPAKIIEKPKQPCLLQKVNS